MLLLLRLLSFFYLLLVAIITSVAKSSTDHDICSPSEDIIAIDCGTSSNSTDSSGRKWSGDDVTTNFTVETPELKTVSDIVGVPYNTCRISTSEFSYSFDVSPGPKFVRLYFYRTERFKPSVPLFTVRANRYTLLSNFGDTDAKAKPIAVEFIIYVEEDGVLKLDFIPANSSCHAFVNGIQVVSMPENLYYTKRGDKGLTLLTNPTPTYFQISNNIAMETVQRLNVGGPDIPPMNDSNGMFRSWINDDTYLTTTLGTDVDDLNQSSVLNSSVDCAAPTYLYQTWRSIGSIGDPDLNVNVTWSFLVDLGVTYMFRHHFSQRKENYKELPIYIANHAAQVLGDADIGWRKHFYRDYAVKIQTQGNDTDTKKNNNVSLSIYARGVDFYYAVILNGIELFKLSNDHNNFSGFNPDDLRHLSRQRKGNYKPRFYIIVGTLCSLAFISMICYFVAKHIKKQNIPLQIPTRTKSLGRGLCRRFSLDEIKTATNDFDDSSIIGSGGFGNVYRGYVDGTVAIKRLKRGSSQGAEEFKTEIMMLSRLRHVHLVSLIGYCDEDEEMMLVYDYMGRGTLCGHLYNTTNPPLLWMDRVKICIGAARGLHYLHTGSNRAVIHRDVKSSNILIDDDWVAKVSDFGLSKIGPSASRTHVTTHVKGTFGYLDPEYFLFHQLTVKSDVFAFGVVLLEVLCARPPVKSGLEFEQVGLAGWAKSCSTNQMLDQIVDPHLKDQISEDSLHLFASTALSCLLDDSSGRPSMCHVLRNLELVLQLEQEHHHNSNLEQVEEDSEEARLRNCVDDDEQ